MAAAKINTLFTIGHSTRTIGQFLALLKAHEIERLVDIRTIPKSRHNPQFNKDALAKKVRNAGIGYRHLAELGGLRHAAVASLNMGWKNLSFRGFADYMATDEFSRAIAKLANIAQKKKTAMMCAEAVPWRCHRSLIADVLTKQSWKVFHIMSRKTAYRHKLTPFLRIRDRKMVYPEL